MTRSTLLLGLLLCALTGCHDGPDHGTADAPAPVEETITIYRLDGDAGRQPDSTSTFHEWLITRSRTISDPATQQSLLAALQAGIDDPDARPMRCFIPRHGIRHRQADGETMDYVICFQCGLYRASLDGQEHAGGTIGRADLQKMLDALM